MNNQLLSLTNSLIAVDSVKEKNENLHAILNTVVQQFSDFTVERFESNSIPSVLIYPQEVRPDRFKIILNGHLDIVAAKPEQLNPVIRDGKLYGRGAYDMKAAAAAEILIFKEIAKELPFPLALQLVTDEEIGGLNGTKYQVDSGVRGDFVIAGEPTNYGVNNKAKGIIWAKITFTGKTGHGAYPWQGENALWKMNHFLDALKVMYPVPEKEIWKTTVNLAKIETSNATFNKIPEDAVVWIDTRYIPEDTEKFITAITDLVGISGKIDFLMREPAQFTDENNTFVVSLRRTVAATTGVESPIIVKHGGSDIRHFNAVGCDGVTFGPIGAGLHTDDEWVDIKSLEDYYLILKNYLLSLS